jgi:hypothetical protein
MQVAGWMLLFAIVALSVVPQPLRPEHASEFFDRVGIWLGAP